MNYATEAIKTIEEPKFTCADLAKAHKLHPSTIRKMFIDEEGVIRIGHPGVGRGRRKRQYFTLRIPATVAARVFGRLTVCGREAGRPEGENR